MEEVTWKPEDVDIETPSVARVYDYALGGWHNFAADREAAEQVMATMPRGAAQKRAWVNRWFLRRAVRYCLEAGVTQFLDIGSGLPSVGNVHETAQGINPDARVVYVDVDPVAYTHCRMMLEGNDRAGAVHADLRDPDRVFNHTVTTGLLDLDQPLGLLMVAVLPFIPDEDDLVALLGRYSERLAPGSYFALSHVSDDDDWWDDTAVAYKKSVANMFLRSRAEVEALFSGFVLVEPGVVWAEDWPHCRQEEFMVDPPTRWLYTGLGCKP